LRSVHLSEPELVARRYPHELSGGMAQRVAIAIAVGSGCRLLIADEPTAALDASIRRQILDLLVALSIEKGAALVLLSHDLPAIAKHCERVAVMYGGRIVECGSCETVFRRPRHPYTAALLKADPGNIGLGDRLEPILGTPPLLRGASHNCSFAPRCAHAVEACHATRPAERVLEGRIVACIRAEETAATMGSGPI
jgi:oligopeptide/dipeptide ABC transporter ATP-binding protein